MSNTSTNKNKNNNTIKESKKNSLNSKETLKGLDNLSLGVSISVAIAIGVAIGIWLQNLTGSTYGLFFGIALGIGAAILNVYKAYKRLAKDLEGCKDLGLKYDDVNYKDSGYISSKNAYKNPYSKESKNQMYGNEEQLKKRIKQIKKQESQGNSPS
jgi:F0F1-type ATP synthase assembly protein I